MSEQVGHIPAVDEGRSQVPGLATVGLVLALAASLVLVAPASPASAGTTVYRVEKKLHELRYPVGAVDGTQDARTRLGLCAWRETHGMKIGRRAMTDQDVASILSATRRPSTSRSKGIYVNETCQMLYQVRDGKYRRIVRVSTGRPGYGTPNGTGEVWRKWAGWHESSIYSGGWMLDSIYFRRDRPGIALHGSKSDSYVKPYPASHGCVRLRQWAIRKIFDETPKGHKVRVYGAY
ncbi:MAG: L,D-transpeptidase [Actinomycetes bacterium]